MTPEQINAAAKATLTKDDPAGWYECRPKPWPSLSLTARWWTGSALHCYLGGDGEHVSRYEEFRPLLRQHSEPVRELSLPDAEGWWWEMGCYEWAMVRIVNVSQKGLLYRDRPGYQTPKPGRWIPCLPPASPTPALSARDERLAAEPWDDDPHPGMATLAEIEAWEKRNPAPSPQASVSGEGDAWDRLLQEWSGDIGPMPKHVAAHPDTCREIVAAMNTSSRLTWETSWAKWIVWWLVFERRRAKRHADDARSLQSTVERLTRENGDILDLLRRSFMEHGDCKSGERYGGIPKACTACMAQIKLKELVAAWKGHKIRTAFAGTVPYDGVGK